MLLISNHQHPTVKEAQTLLTDYLNTFGSNVSASEITSWLHLFLSERPTFQKLDADYFALMSDDVTLFIEGEGHNLRVCAKIEQPQCIRRAHVELYVN